MLFNRSPRRTADSEMDPEWDEACYVVLVADSRTGLTHTHGPFDPMAALVAADALRAGLDTAGRTDVRVGLGRVQRPDALAEYVTSLHRLPGR
jgi:hypothetical protein